MKIVKVIYKCNGCGIETNKPYEKRLREFTKGRGMKKQKIHLCPVCYHSLDKMFEMSEEVENSNAHTSDTTKNDIISGKGLKPLTSSTPIPSGVINKK